jgi:hypothetical protein
LYSFFFSLKKINKKEIAVSKQKENWVLGFSFFLQTKNKELGTFCE